MKVEHGKATACCTGPYFVFAPASSSVRCIPSLEELIASYISWKAHTSVVRSTCGSLLATILRKKRAQVSRPNAVDIL